MQADLGTRLLKMLLVLLLGGKAPDGAAPGGADLRAFRPSGAPVGAESFYLAFAMDPTSDGRYGNKPDVVSGEHLGEVNFEAYDVVILANVGQFPLTVDPGGGSGYGQLDALSRYVRSGGGLAIFTGDRVNPTFYNGPFYDRGKGLCPIQKRRKVRARKTRLYLIFTYFQIIFWVASSSQTSLGAFRSPLGPQAPLLRVCPQGHPADERQDQG